MLVARSLLPVSTTTSLPTQTFSLILAGNVFAEISDSGFEGMVATMLERLAPGGTIICIEPALKVATHRLMRVRDLWCRSNKISVLYPCTHSAPCPMLRHTPHDWCHGELTWTPPRLIQTLDELTGFNKHRIKYSACVARAGSGLESTQYRVVTPPENDRRGTSLTLCGPEFFDLVRLSKRNRSEANLAFRRASLWDALTVNPRPMAKEISTETAVTANTHSQKRAEFEGPL